MADSTAPDETATTSTSPAAAAVDDTTETKKKRKRKDIRFVVTGFGPFQGVPSNPTTVIANQLIEYLEQDNSNHHVKHLAHVTTTTVLEVSVQAVQQFLDTTALLPQQDDDDHDAVVVLLHLGVNYRGTAFQLEKQAYNNAHFRVPDQQGFQPDKQLIVADLPLEHVLTTSLPVDMLCQQLQDDLKNVTVAVKVNEVNAETSTSPDSINETEQETATKGNDEKKQGTTTEDNDEKKQEETVETRADTATTTKNNEDNEQSANSITDGETTTQEPIKIMTSMDPGRFVCNYTYCYSLNKFCRNPADETTMADATQDGDEKERGGDSKPTTPGQSAPESTNTTTTNNSKQFFSLFLHVPPSNIVPEDIQIQFVAQLMKTIEDYIQSL